MTNEEALEKLELENGASQQDIKQQYQEFYNEFKIRITNAPTTHQKTLYQNKLKQLEEAFNILIGQDTGGLDNEIPWSSPGKTGPGSKPPEPTEKITKTKALELLGINEPFTNEKLEKTFKAKKAACETGMQNALNDDVRRAYISALKELTSAYRLMIPLAIAEEQPVSQPKQEKDHPRNSPKKKDIVTKKGNDYISKKPYLIIGSTVILAILVYVAYTIYAKNQYDKHLSQADNLASSKNYEEALVNYKKAFDFKENAVIKDSIQSMELKIKEIINSNITFVTKLSSKSLGINERLKVEFEMDKDGDNFTPPSFEGFTIISGPQQSVSNSWINGKRHFKKTYSYFLSPQKKGKIKIGTATIEIDGKIHETDSFLVTVTKATQHKSAIKEKSLNDLPKERIHLVAEYSRTNLNINESLTILYKLYIPFEYELTVEEYKPPSSDDFTVVKRKADMILNTVTYQGEKYRLIEIDKLELFPHKIGVFLIDPFRLEVKVDIPSNKRDIFGSKIRSEVLLTVSSDGDRIINVR
ncbi:BatD family protein [Tamlana flava]|uniref:BatD family protein n=1 Tax=Tamlana flava TaxID=3158572 RepID=UPI00351B2A04